MNPFGQPRIAKRRYNQLKKTILNDQSQVANSHLTDTPLHKNQAYYQQMFERTQAIKLLIDPDDGQIVDANLAACQFYGYTLEQIKSLRITAINVQPEATSRADMRYALTHEGANFEFQHRIASGAIRDVEVSVALLEVNHKNYLYAFIQNITERKQAEKALRESEALYRLFARNMPDSSVFMFDMDMRFTLAEGPYLRRSQPLDQNIVGKLPHEVLPVESLNFLLPIYQRALNGESFSYEHVTPNYAYQANVAPLRNDEGQIIGGMILSHDITERKQLEDELVASEERYRTLIDFAPVGIVETDNRGAIVLSNNKWSALSGITLNSPTPDEASVTIHPDDLAKTRAVNQLMLDTAQHVDNLEYRFLHPDGKVVWVSDSSRALLDSNGTVRGYIVAITDITERKRLEEQLRTNEERLRIITDNIHDLITQNNIHGQLVFVSASSRKMLGYEPDFLLNTSSLDLIHPDDQDAMRETFRKAYEAGSSQFTVEGRLRHADGHYVSVETIGKIVFDEHSHPASGVYISRDITERKRIQELHIKQEKLQTALEKEQELSNLKTRMMQRITHEFRTPLAIIQILMETLTHYYERLTPKQRETKAATVKNQIQHITNMLGEIALIVNGSFMPNALYRVSTDVSALCRRVAAKLASHSNLPDKYRLDVPETLIMSVDPAVLENALLHIMRNAAHFSEPSAVVTVRLSQLENTVELCITDTGIGIQPDELPRIFEPFFRGSNINERSGLGVGLTIARAAIEAHGGWINVESELGKGTSVIISLPIEKLS